LALLLCFALTKHIHSLNINISHTKCKLVKITSDEYLLTPSGFLNQQFAVATIHFTVWEFKFIFFSKYFLLENILKQYI